MLAARAARAATARVRGVRAAVTTASLAGRCGGDEAGRGLPDFRCGAEGVPRIPQPVKRTRRRDKLNVAKGPNTYGFQGRRDGRLSPSRGCTHRGDQDTRHTGRRKALLKLKVAQGDLTIEVPAENCDLVGVRDVVGAEGPGARLRRARALRRGADELVAPLQGQSGKLASGDVIKVAEVVRDLWRRDKERGLSAGEKRMLAKARQILVSELALAEKTDEVKAESILDEVLAS